MQTATGFISIPEGKLFWRYDTHSITPTPMNPFVLFLHAAVADHTLWDEQVAYLVERGWDCLRYDRLGYGQSTLSDEYLQSAERPPIAHYEHPGIVISDLQLSRRKCVLVGLSMGAYTALDFALDSPSQVAGVLLCSGGVSGFAEPPMPELDRGLFQKYDAFLEEASQEKIPEDSLSKAAETQVRIWGDGLQASEGRLREPGARIKLFDWCRDIAAKEANKTGGFAIPSRDPRPPAAERLKTDLRRELIIRTAFGRYDEKGTIEGMKYVHDEVNVKIGDKNAELTEFDAAHMCNMEEVDKFNRWVQAFLDKVVT